MTVFKNYLKITKSYLSIIVIYTLIFVVIAMITSQSGAMNQETFQTEKAKIAMVNNDENSPLMKDFQTYVQEHAEYIELENTEEKLKDALFFRRVDYIMIIPQNFTHDFLNHQDVKIETMEVPDSYGSIYSKKLMNRYLNTAKLYLKADITPSEMTQLIHQDLSIHSETSMMNQSSIDSQIINVCHFFNFSNYTFLAIIISVISMVMISFRDEHIQNRQMISCTSYQKLNIQLLLGNITVTIGIWLLYVFAACFLYGQTMFTPQGFFISMNALVFVIFVLVLSFLLLLLIKDRNVVSGVSTIIALGTSFIAGAFVPQEFLSSFVLTLAKFTPSYWFITNNQDIAQLSKLSWINLQPIIINMSIVFGFTVLLLIIIQGISYLRLKH